MNELQTNFLTSVAKARHETEIVYSSRKKPDLDWEQLIQSLISWESIIPSAARARARQSTNVYLFASDDIGNVVI